MWGAGLTGAPHTSRHSERQRPAHDDLVGLRLVAQRQVDGAHRRVLDVVLGLQRDDAVGGRPRDRRALERTGDAAPAVGGHHTRHVVPGRRWIRAGEAEARVPGDLVAGQRDEDRVATRHAAPRCRRRPTPRTCRPCAARPVPGMSCAVASATACSARSRSGRSASVVISMPAGASTARTSADGTSSATARERSYSANPRRSSQVIPSGRDSQVGTCSAAFPIAGGVPGQATVQLAADAPSAVVVDDADLGPRPVEVGREHVDATHRPVPDGGVAGPDEQTHCARVRALGVLELVGGVRPLGREGRRQRCELARAARASRRPRCPSHPSAWRDCTPRPHVALTRASYHAAMTLSSEPPAASPAFSPSRSSLSAVDRAGDSTTDTTTPAATCRLDRRSRRRRATAVVAGKVSANDASVDELTAAFEAAGIPNAERWASEWPSTARTTARTPRGRTSASELAKYDPDQQVVEQISRHAAVDATPMSYAAGSLAPRRGFHRCATANRRSR